MTETIYLKREELGTFLTNLSSLPEILAGRSPKYVAFRKLFWGYVAKKLFEKIQKSFQERSHGRPDDQGNTWHPLSERRVRVKSGIHVSHGRRFKSTTPKLVNRDSGDLYRAFTPGRVTGEYVPGDESQTFRIFLGGLTVGVKVPYATQVAKTRELIPKNVNRWVQEAVNYAIEKTKVQLRSLARRT